MAVPSNRSPSPLSSRPNPHSRNSESNSTIRRSFSGNPFPRPSVLTNPKSFNPVTPANSPAGFGRRNSVGKEGMGQFQSSDEKENDKDQILKPVKVRSPANGSKNFMSPTVSAASKFTPSPRKKPLVERNDPVRTSISLSDGKATFLSAISSENTEDFVPKSELLAEQKTGEDFLESTVTHLDQKEAVLECPPASKAMKRVTFAELPKNGPSCFSVSPVTAPLDADPSIPPYDPKTNYLSPRPQFLHYKPNPRIEVLLNNKEKGLHSGVKRLEDSFILESSSVTFSDTDGTEESNSEDSHKDSEDSSSAETEEPEVKEEELHVSESSIFSTTITHELHVSESNSEDSHKDSEDSFSAETEEPEVKEEELHVSESSIFSTTITHETSEEEELRVSEKLDISTPISQEIPEQIVGGKGKEKGRFFTSLKIVSLLLVFLIGGISFSFANSPIMDSSVLKTLNFSEVHLPSVVADTAKANFDAFAGRFKQLSFDSISHLSFLINNLGRHDMLRPLQFINLTDLQKDILVGGYLRVSESLPISPTAHEVSENVVGVKGSEKLTGNFGKEDEEDGESLPFEEETYVGAVSDDISETESDGKIDWGTQELTSTPAPVPQMKEPESLETVWSQEEAAFNADTEVKCKINAEDYVDPASEALEDESEEKAPEIESELLEATKLEGAIDLGSGAKVESSSEVDIYLESTSDVTPLRLGHRHSEMVESPIGGSQNLLSAYYITGVTSIVLALMSAAAYVYLKRGTTSKPNPAVHTDQLLSKKIIPALSVLEQIHKERPSSQNWPTEVDVMGESCPSEMSSFQTSSSHSRLRGANEAQSQERKSRKQSKRESLASSSECSMGSPSYGSFTTYEKIPIKHASGDDEIMTPVRRSSRIRNLVTSP